MGGIGSGEPRAALSRRDWLTSAAAVATAYVLPWPGPVEAAATTHAEEKGGFVLSERGSGRATGYAEANRIVTHDGRTHVAWLDSPPEGFRVRIRTWDREKDQWSSTWTVGEAADNHGGPALTIDSQGFLHIIYHPHHGPMRHRRSSRPGDASAWEQEVAFGERLTYPTLVCGPDDTLYLTARRSFPDRPWQVEMWKRPPGDGWQRVGALLASRHRGYAHFQESLAWGPDHKTLHLCCRFHEKSGGGAYGRIQTVAYLVSDDTGRTWRRSDGEAVPLPATAESAEVLASGGVDVGRVLRAGAMAVDAAGVPHLIYHVLEDGRSRTFIARQKPDGWERTALNAFLPEPWASWHVLMPGGLSFDCDGRLTAAAMIQDPDRQQSRWGDPTSEIVRFQRRDDGSDFGCELVSRTDETEAHWLANIERPTGHHTVGCPPSILYTAGGAGDGNRDLLSNRVLLVG